MNVLDFFKPSADPKPNTALPGADANKPADPAKPAADPNNPAKDTENPFDGYQKMFDNAAKNSDIQAPSFSLDPKIVAEVSSKMDFTKGINPELLQKATGGDASAMMQLINETSRNAYRAALEHGTKLTDTHLGQRSEFESKRLSKDVKQHLTSSELSSKPNLNHPLIKAEVNSIAQRMANAPEYADASPSQIAEAALQYFNDLHAAMNPVDPTKTKEGKVKAGEVDYMAYLGLDKKS